MVARKMLRRSVAVKAHCDDTSYGFTGVWGPIKLEGVTAAGWVASELIQGIPNGAAKSGVSLQEWDGTDMEGKWGIVLPSGKDNHLTSWNRVNDKKDPYVTLGFPETGAINYRLADEKSVHNIGVLNRVASNAGGTDVAEQRGILMMASAGNRGYYQRGGTIGREESKAVDVANRGILKGRGIMRDNTLLCVVHAPVEWGGAGFPFDEQFGRGALLDEVYRTWCLPATTPQCLAFQSAWAVMAWMQGCDVGSALSSCLNTR